MISRILAVLTLLALSASASAFTARTGHWYNPAESGSGYNIDIQDGVLVITIFSYKPGDSEWYISSGPMSASQSTYTGSLLAVRGGQCISCLLRVQPRRLRHRLQARVSGRARLAASDWPARPSAIDRVHLR